MGLTRTASAATLTCALTLGLLANGSLQSDARADSTTDGSDLHAPGDAISPAALDILSDAQRALVEARDLAAALDEHAALSRLLAAERGLREILHVQGVHAWLAEVWLQMALVAAQRGELELADSLFARALSVDPTRHVGAAEAAPPVIARSTQVARNRDAAQRSRFRIEPSPESTSSWIDGRQRGMGARDVDLAPGLHLLLLEAPGHRAHGTLIDALPGARRPWLISLSPNANTEAVATAKRDASRKGVLATRSDRDRTQPQPALRKRAQWWKRWPVWMSVASVALAGGIAIGFAARDERRIEQRTVIIDPGESEP